MNYKKGATLIELVIVIGLLAVLAQICIPYFKGAGPDIQKMNLEMASKELLSDLRLSQQKAKSEGNIYHVYFDVANNSYKIYSYRDRQECVYKERKLPDGIFHDNVESTYSGSMVSFNSRGKPLPHPCTIALVNSFGERRLITIKVGTDYISLKDGSYP